jgi:UDPglucose 6-dehydrogenase
MKKITIVGTGYVGLVTGVGLSEFGNKVICADINQDKILELKKGNIPIYEPGLEELVDRNVTNKRLVFSSDISASIRESDVIIIAVGTPESDNGEAEMKHVFSVVDVIEKNLNDYKVICTKSTVPIGTGEKITKVLKTRYKENIDFDYVSNPEFLREGYALKDFLWPDKIVIGSSNKKAFKIMCDMYKALYINKNPIISTSVESAEMIKYAANSFLALKISFINEIANLCELVGADVHDVTKAMGKSSSISEKYLHPGPGFGGSCFPKDLESLSAISKKNNLLMETINAAIKANKNQKVKMGHKLKKLVGGVLKNKRIAIFGLAFKANTDDIRESSSIDIINYILNQGGKINAYDPIANDSMSKIFTNVSYFDDLYDSAKNVDAVVIMTEWNEFRAIDLSKLRNIMKGHFILDTRNIINMKELSDLGFVYDNIGRVKV